MSLTESAKEIFECYIKPIMELDPKATQEGLLALHCALLEVHFQEGPEAKISNPSTHIFSRDRSHIFSIPEDQEVMECLSEFLRAEAAGMGFKHAVTVCETWIAEAPADSDGPFKRASEMPNRRDAAVIISELHGAKPMSAIAYKENGVFGRFERQDMAAMGGRMLLWPYTH